jgi:GNAT superfamily N-acetyltransferase
MIKTIALSDIDAVISLHMESLPEDFFPQLGKFFLTQFYSAALQSEYCTIFGFYHEKTLLGFIFLTTNSSKVLSDIVSKNFFRIVYSAVSGVIKNRSLLKGLIWNSARTIFSRKPDRLSSKIHPEVYFIVVREKSRSKNIGSTLINEAKSYFCNMGFHQMKVKTLKNNNEKTIEFYKKNGGTIIEEFDFFNRCYLYFMFELALSNNQ